MLTKEHILALEQSRGRKHVGLRRQYNYHMLQGGTKYPAQIMAMAPGEARRRAMHVYRRDKMNQRNKRWRMKECSICLKWIGTKSRKKRCDHCRQLFHKRCLHRSLQQSYKCPLCREVCDVKRVDKNMQRSVHEQGPFSIVLFSLEEQDDDGYIVEDKQITIHVREEGGGVVYTLVDSDSGRNQRYGELEIELVRTYSVTDLLQAVVELMRTMLSSDVTIHGTEHATVPVANDPALITQALFVLRSNLIDALLHRSTVNWGTLTVQLVSFEHPDIDMIADQDEWVNHRTMWKITVT